MITALAFLPRVSVSTGVPHRNCFANRKDINSMRSLSAGNYAVSRVYVSHHKSVVPFFLSSYHRAGTSTQLIRKGPLIKSRKSLITASRFSTKTRDKYNYGQSKNRQLFIKIQTAKGLTEKSRIECGIIFRP